MITHARARAHLHLGEDALDRWQAEQLASHLKNCRACREYAALQKRLAPAITRELHIRWDAEIENYRLTPLPTNLRSKTMLFKRVVAFAAAGVVVVAAILGAPVLLQRVMPPAGSPSTVLPAGGIPTQTIDPTLPTNALPLQLDPTVCMDQATPDLERGIRAYPVSGVISGGEVENGDFIFKFWLYCDEKLSPGDMEHFSALGGLGVYSRWTYKGHKIEGEFWDMFGVDPDVRMVTGSPMLSNSGASMSGGLHLPDTWDVAEMAVRGEPLRFIVQVQSIDGIYGAELAFRLHAGKNGYIPEGIEVQVLPVEAISKTQPALP